MAEVRVVFTADVFILKPVDLRRGNGRLYYYIGSYLPFAWTQAEREAVGDARLSVEERYRGREDYLGRVALAALSLVCQRLLLAEDVPFVVERAAAHWDWRAAQRR